MEDKLKVESDINTLFKKMDIFPEMDGIYFNPLAQLCLIFHTINSRLKISVIDDMRNALVVHDDLYDKFKKISEMEDNCIPAFELFRGMNKIIQKHDITYNKQEETMEKIKDDLKYITEKIMVMHKNPIRPKKTLSELGMLDNWMTG